MESFANIEVSTRDAVGVITMNRPQARNALNSNTFLELERALSMLESNANIGAIVVTGAGDKAFVAGADIDEMSHLGGIDFYRGFGAIAHRVFRRLETCEKPTLAAVNGWALGGGAELMLSVDIRFIAESGRIGFPEIGLGIFPGAGGTQRLTRQIPLCHAKDLLFSGNPVSAQRALEIGLVNYVTSKESLMEEALAHAAHLASRPRVAMRLLKAAVVQGGDMPLSAALEYERSLAGLSFATHDAHEGLSAFAEKRTPKYSET